MHEIVIAVLNVDAQLIMKERRTAVQIESCQSQATASPSDMCDHGKGRERVGDN